MSMTFNDQQQEAIFSKEPLVVVAAGAGSGKTRVLTERVMHLCELAFLEPESSHGAQIDAISAITFTEKAAREMKQRIRASLEDKLQSAIKDDEKMYWSNQKEALDRAVISTFHSFCQRLLNQYAYQAGLPASFHLLDEVGANVLKQDVLQSLFTFGDFFSQAEPLIHLLGKDQLSTYLRQVYDQMRELQPGEDNVQQLIGNEMWEKQCKAQEEAWISQLKEFDSLANQAIKSFPASGLSKANQAHVDRMVTFFSDVSNRTYGETFKDHLEDIMPNRVNRKWEEEIPGLYQLFEQNWKPLKEKMKERSKSSFMEENSHYLERFIWLIQAFDKSYRNQKLFRGGLDFTDLQQKALTLLEDKEIQQKCREELTHMMIDEFQDTNALQLEVLNRIRPHYRFIVGDTKQSIYQFRGADVSIMNDLEQDAEADPFSRRVLMNTNYRTVGPIVSAVNTVFSKAMTHMQTYSYQTLYQPLQANREPNHTSEGEAVELLSGELDEYDLMANRMVELVYEKKKMVFSDDQWRSASWRDMAVLIPTRTHLRKLEKALTVKQIPYEVQSGIGFYERREVVDFLTLLRWINEPYEDFYLLALLRSPLFGLTINDFLILKNSCKEHQTIGDYVCFDEEFFSEQLQHPHLVETVTKLREWIKKWVPIQPIPTFIDALYELLEQSGLKTSLLLQTGGLQRVRNVEKFIETLANEQEDDLPALLESIQSRIEWSAKEGDSSIERAEGDAVTIMTVHGSKGLEFPIVFLPQLHKRPQSETGRIRFHSSLGIVMNLENTNQNIETPGYHLVKAEADDKATEEAKRLFYVAATRARDKLILVKGNHQPAAFSWLQMINDADEDLLTGTWYQERTAEEAPMWQKTQGETYSVPTLRQETKKIPVAFSVSQITSFINNPSHYVEQYLRGKNPQIVQTKSLATHGLASDTLGTLVHRACELFDLGWSIDESVMLAVEENHTYLTNKTIYKKEIKELLVAYSQLPIGESIANEWSFSIELEGAEISGTIDRVASIQSDIYLFDIKTHVLSQSGEELTDRYKAQLVLYKWAYEQLTGQAVAGLYLVTLRDQKKMLHEITVTDFEENEIRVAIRHLVNLKTTSTSIETYTHSYRYK
ncbi:UvrD-helicase domain-containing protein [Alkalicoccobacillus murimartini]|uniref:DNA 3'-5' helicase n=1 Tax=Alkalicoccobacillus murimartini TaxID=171685 RepID=A0ABT9YJD1_9BACI|nr:UvrD-helicase domain-containing protein [Alkalicoccobacillus murimartini]MDQ0207964.1 ATP-dependent exoDNAse (exonuclease V) beta subunit [Alkalicoccobacillus murimartini]